MSGLLNTATGIGAMIRALTTQPWAGGLNKEGPKGMRIQQAVQGCPVSGRRRSRLGAEQQTVADELTPGSLQDECGGGEGAKGLKVDQQGAEGMGSGVLLG